MSRSLRYLVVIAVAVALVGCGVPKSEHEQLEQQYSKVQAEIGKFNENVSKMQKENLALKDQIKELNAQIAKLEQKNAVVSKAYKELSEAQQKAEAAQAAKQVQ